MSRYGKNLWPEVARQDCTTGTRTLVEKDRFGDMDCLSGVEMRIRCLSISHFDDGSQGHRACKGERSVGHKRSSPDMFSPAQDSPRRNCRKIIAVSEDPMATDGTVTGLIPPYAALSRSEYPAAHTHRPTCHASHTEHLRHPDRQSVPKAELG